MDKLTVKLLNDWMGHKADTVLELDETTAKELIASDDAKEYDPEKEGQAKKEANEQAKSLENAIEKAIKPLEEKINKIQYVKENVEEDPCHGYLGEHNKSLKDLSDGEVHFAFGKFFKDLVKCRQGSEPELLKNSRERTEKMIAKAAGDGMVVSDDEFGGYLIFPAAMQMIQQSTVEASVIRPRASRVTMGTQILKAPMIRDENRTSGQIYNGIQVLWESELDQFTSSRPKLRNVEWVLKKLMGAAYLSGEWAKWSPVTAGSWLVPKFGEAIGYKEDIAFINGKGGGQPLGILNSGCKIAVSAEDEQDANTFVLDNSTEMRARAKIMKPGSTAWLMNQSLFPQLPLLNVEVGTGGAPVFVNNAASSLPQSLWGFPIVFSEKLPVLGDAGDVVLTDLSDYVVADDQSGPQIASSIHLKFDYDQECIRFIKYVDGQNLSDTAFTPYQAGSTSPDTLSPVVTLAERA